MDRKIPIIYLLHGDDHVGINDFIESMIAKMGNPDEAQMNTSRLFAGSNVLGDLRSTCMVLPFLSERRLVVLEGFTELVANNTGLSRSKGKASPTSQQNGNQLIDFFQQIPPTTALVLLAEDDWIRDRGGWRWKVFHDSHWMMKWIYDRPDVAFYRCFNLPRGNEMTSWIIDRATKMGGQITPAGAQALALATGNDTQLGCQELEKVLAYVNYQKPVEVEDVNVLTSPIVVEDVFAMADAIGRKDAKKALKALHVLLAVSSPEELMGMVSRQIRLLIIVKEALMKGKRIAEISGMIRLPAGIAQKYIDQSKGFNINELIRIHHMLLDIDEANKTGGMPIETALDALVVSLSGK